MDLDDLLTALRDRQTITGGSPLHEVMHQASQDALRITSELNAAYQPPGRVRELLSELTGAPVEDSVTVFPPLSSDFGKNLRIGARVFINSGCHFQDQGCITIGDDCLIGHNPVLATLNHDLDPTRRGDLHPAPIVLGRNVWIGANVTILPGVTIGDNAVIGAGSLVSKDIPADVVAVGTPAKVIRKVTAQSNS